MLALTVASKLSSFQKASGSCPSDAHELLCFRGMVMPHGMVYFPTFVATVLVFVCSVAKLVVHSSKRLRDDVVWACFFDCQYVIALKIIGDYAVESRVTMYTINVYACVALAVDMVAYRADMHACGVVSLFILLAAPLAFFWGFSVFFGPPVVALSYSGHALDMCQLQAHMAGWLVSEVLLHVRNILCDTTIMLTGER